MKEQIRELYDRYAELEKVEAQASDMLVSAKRNGGDNEVPVLRKDATVMVKEKHLWTEVFALGSESAAGEILKKIYPRVFELYEKQNRLADELRDFTIAAFRIDYTKLKMSDIIRLFEMLADYRATQPTVPVRTTFASRLRWLLTGQF